ncbi:36864_t:CDS:1 [Gigaspora margarita]|uniref:36864_t:CDS:1 n=1 Tax=Gigaspora margarita TaxID=4874 RepID=A0ABN7V605_GIGMA|nr:36864_t:CDS:1 [Gigaspora margarita]
MKFLSNLTIFLVLIIVIAQAVPVKRDLGPKVKAASRTLGNDYQAYALKVQSIHKDYKKKIKEFDKKLKEAAKEDGTDEKTLKWLTKWNNEYGKLVNKLQTTAIGFIERIDKLKKKLEK